MTRYIGLDLHARYVHGCEWNPSAPEGHKEQHFRFPNTPDGWSRICAQLDNACWVALEVTGSAFEIYDRLSPHAGQVLLANPVELRRLGSGRHTDHVDAARLAKMLAISAVPSVWVPPPPMREVRRLLYYRERLVSNRCRYVNQAKAVLRRHGCSLPSRHVDVAHALTPDTLTALPETDQAILFSALRQAAVLQDEIDGIERQIARCVNTVPAVSTLLTLTGLGFVAATATWAVIGDPRRFSSAKKVTRYLGLDASIFQSGEQHHQGHISKNGNPLLRTLLVEAANSVALHDKGPLGQFYRRKARQIGHKKAIVALARKLLVVAWRMLMTGEIYRAAKPQTVTRKHQELQRKASLRLSAPVGQPGQTVDVHPSRPVPTTRHLATKTGKRTLVPA